MRWLPALLRISILSMALLSLPASTAPLRYTTGWVGNTGGGAQSNAQGNVKDGTGNWVQNSIDAIHVMPDGRVFAVTRWDEGSAEISIYQNGVALNHAGSTHGWGNSGGEAIAANDRYLFAAMQIDNEGGTLSDPASDTAKADTAAGANAPANTDANASASTMGNARNWPARGHEWFGITRRAIDDPSRGMPFIGGVGNHGNPASQSFLIVNDLGSESRNESKDGSHMQDGAIRGLAANAHFLFVSNTLRNRVDVYDAETMRLDHGFDVAQPGKLALDADGSIWVISGFSDPVRARLRHYTTTGEALPTPELTGLTARLQSGLPTSLPTSLPNRSQTAVPDAAVVPVDVAFAPNGDMLVADGGAAQQILYLERTAHGYRLGRTFGERGGVFAGPAASSGAPASARFDGLVGVGADAAGNLYVATNGYGPRPFGGQRGTFGSVIDSYAPDGSRRWQLLGLLFADGLDIDPAEPDTVYSGSKRFRIDDSRAAGRDWTYIGTTGNRRQYPQDAQFNLDAGWRGQPMVRRLDGQRFLFLTDMYSSYLKIYRFDAATAGEVAIPSGFFARSHLPGAWPPHQPARGEWIWRDSNGNGRFDAGEFTTHLGARSAQASAQSSVQMPQASAEVSGMQSASSPISDDAPDLWGWWVDEGGDIWQAMVNDGLRQFGYRGLDANGNPSYSFVSARHWAMPAPFTELRRIRYDKKNDVMYLSGYTAEAPYDRKYWKEAGRVLARYDGWKSRHRKLRYTINLPWQVAWPEKHVTMAFAQAGDYLFAVETFTATVHVYDASTGALIGEISPGPEVGRRSGWVDVPAGINAWRRPDGSYRIAVEDDQYGKVILYRWDGR